MDHHLREAEIAISKEKAQSGSGETEAFTDNVIMYEFLSELRDIAARPNGITCGCGSHSYSMEIRGTPWSLRAVTAAHGCGSAPPRTGTLMTSAAT